MIYSDQKCVKRFFRDIGKLLKRILKDESYDVYIDIEESDEIKRRDVIIWSVILNKRDDVMFLLKNGLTEDANHTKGTCLYAALFASAMLKVLSKLADAEENMDLGASFMENSRFFEILACNGVAQMYSNDRVLTQKILTQPVKEYGCSMKTVMKISANNEQMQFMGTTACQTKLKSIWREHMSILTSREMILACIFFPFFIPCIKFVANKSRDKNNYKEPSLRIDWLGCRDSSEGKMYLIKALYWFYGAPVTKFWTNLISYLLMLCCFSFFVLTNLHPISDGQLSSMEFCIFFWILTWLLEELRQICQREQRLLWHRICSWWTDNWNKFDAVMYIMYLLSVFLRFSMKKDDFVWARMAYSVTLAFFILRTLQFFYVAKNTGPKIIMIGQESSTCTTESLVYRNGTLPRCSESTAIVPIVLAVYMVLTNLMLLNLLIAMFSIDSDFISFIPFRDPPRRATPPLPADDDIPPPPLPRKPLPGRPTPSVPSDHPPAVPTSSRPSERKPQPQKPLPADDDIPPLPVPRKPLQGRPLPPVPSGHSAVPTSSRPPQPKPQPQKFLHTYDKLAGQRGLLLVINFKFAGQNERTASGEDVRKLHTFFSELDYDIVCQSDMTTNELKRSLEKIRYEYLTRQSHKYHCFICVIMSHGSELGIATQDGTIKVDDLVRPFKNDNAFSFIGKPKIFIIQACRGGRSQVKEQYIEPNIINEADSTVCARLPTDADIIKIFATTPGYYSYRKVDSTSWRGAWFIQAFIAVARELPKSHIQEILTAVTHELAINPEYEIDGEKCQLPMFEAALSKLFYLK